MKKMIFLFYAGLLLATIAEAQTKKENIRELITLTGTIEQYSKTLDTMIPMILNQGNLSDSDEQVKKLTEFAKAEGKAMMQKVMDQDMTGLYDKYYTESDVKEIVAFYKTPAGQKMVKVAPEISIELTQLMMAKYLPDFQKKMVEKMGEMEK